MKFKSIDDECKALKKAGDLPEWYISEGWQLFKEKYLYDARSVREQFERIARHLSSYMPTKELQEEYNTKFFSILWKGHFSASTPIQANTGTKRGSNVACSGNVIDDSIEGFYDAYKEIALLTKNGFGTSSDLSNIRPRGAKISAGGKANGVVPVFKRICEDMLDITQGTARRGQWAGYLDANHPDVMELSNFIRAEGQGPSFNVGWNITDEFIDKLNQGDNDTLKTFQHILKTKMLTGKGYFYFLDKINRARPQAYLNNNLKVYAGNLCTEITLFADSRHTYTCVLGSINLLHWDKIKDSDDIFIATVFLHCVALDFINYSKNKPGLQKARRFTKKGMALGLGVCGFHSYLQSQMIAFGDLQSFYKNQQIFTKMQSESKRASRWLATIFGEPEWCKGTGLANTHLMTVAPTLSTALLIGGVSQGIEPVFANAYAQDTPAGAVNRVNPALMKIMKQRNVYNDVEIDKIISDNGSVMSITWLSDEEKEVFRTAFEINQENIINLAAQRQVWIDQAQSINLFFASDVKEEYIAYIHELAFKNEYIFSLYYIRSTDGSVQIAECKSCSG